MKYLHPRCLTVFAVLSFAIAANAQTQYDLLGLTFFTAELQPTRHTPCVAPPGCALPAGMLPHSNPLAGGVAYDGTENKVWATTGQLLVRTDGAAVCTTDCGPIACPKFSAAANASGLDVVESLDELWVVDDLNYLTQCTIACPPAVNAQCLVTVLPGELITGVAVDDGRGVVFYCAMDTAGSGTLYAAQIATPCSPFFAAPLVDCGSVPQRPSGVAVDWGNSTVYWTNGISTFARPYTYVAAGPTLTLGAQTCCTVLSPNNRLTDLTLRPRSGGPAGNPCANLNCPTCPNIHTLRNAPILGNTLEFGLDAAPEDELAICVIGIGSCTIAPTIPPLCGPLWVPSPSPLPFTLTSGSSGCAGSATVTWALPSAPGFAGLPIASQFIVLCNNTGFGTALSNCVSFTLLGI